MIKRDPEVIMKSLLILSISMLTYSFLSGMEQVPASIVFSNKKGETIEISGEVVSKSPSLNIAYNRHKLVSSIGTLGRVNLEEPELQNLKLIQECIDYNRLETQDLEQRLSIYTHDIPHLMQIIDMSSYLHLNKKVPMRIAALIGSLLQSPAGRCQAFKDGVLARLAGKPEILNLVAQEIIKPSQAKEYWLQRAQESKCNAPRLQEQLNNYLTPQGALVLLDAYESKVKGTGISFIPGDEKALPTALHDLVKPSLTQKLSFAWKRTPKAYKWTMAGLGAATLAATGYGFYSWYCSK
jgi:hypothetical protein